MKRNQYNGTREYVDVAAAASIRNGLTCVGCMVGERVRNLHTVVCVYVLRLRVSVNRYSVSAGRMFVAMDCASCECSSNGRWPQAGQMRNGASCIRTSARRKETSRGAACVEQYIAEWWVAHTFTMVRMWFRSTTTIAAADGTDDDCVLSIYSMYQFHQWAFDVCLRSTSWANAVSYTFESK